jgi:hypothetical protein
MKVIQKRGKEANEKEKQKERIKENQRKKRNLSQTNS